MVVWRVEEGRGGRGGGRREGGAEQGVTCRSARRAWRRTSIAARSACSASSSARRCRGGAEAVQRRCMGGAWAVHGRCMGGAWAVRSHACSARACTAMGLLLVTRARATVVPSRPAATEVSTRTESQPMTASWPRLDSSSISRSWRGWAWGWVELGLGFGFGIGVRVRVQG